MTLDPGNLADFATASLGAQIFQGQRSIIRSAGRRAIAADGTRARTAADHHKAAGARWWSGQRRITAWGGRATMRTTRS